MTEGLSPFAAVVRGCKGSLKAAAGFSLFVNLLQLTIPLYMMQVLDRVISSGSKETLAYLTLIALTALSVSAILDIVRSHILNRAATWLESRLGLEIFPHVALAAHEGKPENLSGLEDLWRVRSFLASPGLIAIFDVPWMVIYIAILFFLALPIGLIALVGGGALLALAIYNETSVRQVLSSAHSATEDSRDFLRAVQNSGDEIIAMGMMPNVIRRWFDRNMLALKDQHSSADRAAANLTLFRLFRLVLQIAVLATGALLVLNGEMTPGGIIGASIIMSRALGPVEQAITAWKQAISAYGAYGRLKEIIPHSEEIGAEIPDVKAPGGLALQHVSYAFPNFTEPFLKDISMEAQPGEILTIVGPSAAGKSTLLKLIMGVSRPTMGFVRLGDHLLQDYGEGVIGDYTGYVPQRSHLIPGTISENLSRFSSVPAEVIISAAKRVSMHEFISALPGGYETIVGGDRGLPLSGGQIQRLVIARAICGHPGLLVLDEPNLNLDAEGENLLYEILQDEIEAGTTIIAVSHMQRMMEMCSRIAVMSDGRLTAVGERDEILSMLQEKMKSERPAERRSAPKGPESK